MSDSLWMRIKRRWCAMFGHSDREIRDESLSWACTLYVFECRRCKRIDTKMETIFD